MVNLVEVGEALQHIEKNAKAEGRECCIIAARLVREAVEEMALDYIRRLNSSVIPKADG